MDQRDYQDFWVTGSRVYVQREDDADGALLDLGIVQTVNPTQEPENIQLEDGDGGILREVEEDTIRITETWEVTTNNFAPDVLALFFMANAPETFTQPTGADIEDVNHTAVVGPGKFVKLHDADGNWVYNVATVTIDTHTEGDDWEWVSKPRGIIRILPDGDIVDGATLVVTMTMNAMTGKRLIKPQTGRGAIRARAMLVYGRKNNAKQTVREALVSITPSGSNMQTEDYSDLTFTARVLSDISEQEMPAGILMQVVGDLPTDAA